MDSFPLLRSLDPAAVLAQLQRDGLALWRGRLLQLDEFENFTMSLFKKFHRPASRTDSRTRDGDGFSTLVEGYTRLLGHSEGYYRPCIAPPDICMFMCVEAPIFEGGETFLVDGAKMLRALPGSLADRLECEGIVYECLWEKERWTSEFGVTDVKSLRRLLDASESCEYQILDQETLHLFYRTSAIHPSRSGNKVFVNGLLAHLPEVKHERYSGISIYAKQTNKIHWGDGGLMEDEYINTMIDAHDGVLERHRWVSGDILLFDNSRFLHGRESLHIPCKRSLLTRFGYCDSA